LQEKLVLIAGILPLLTETPLYRTADKLYHKLTLPM